MDEVHTYLCRGDGPVVYVNTLISSWPSAIGGFNFTSRFIVCQPTHGFSITAPFASQHIAIHQKPIGIPFGLVYPVLCTSGESTQCSCSMHPRHPIPTVSLQAWKRHAEMCGNSAWSRCSQAQPRSTPEARRQLSAMCLQTSKPTPSSCG